MPLSNDVLALLRTPKFWRFQLGSIAASFAQAMFGTAIGWDLYERTHSAFLLGLVGLVQFIPVVLLALPAGQVVDRYDRSRVLMGAIALHVVGVLGLVAATHLGAPLPVFYACLFLSGVAQAFSGPARAAILPRLVPKELLARAVTWNTTAWQLTYLIGPALAGLFIGATRRADTIYLFDAVACIFFLLMLAGLKAPPLQSNKQAPTWTDALVGLKFVMRTELMLGAITLDMFAVLLGGAVVLLPVFAKDVLAVGPQGLGWLIAAPSLGAALTSIVLSALPPIRRNGPVLLWGVAGFGLATVGFALARDPLLAWTMLFLTGVCDTLSVVIRVNLATILTPDEMRGRVEAVHRIFIGTSNELGGFESGVTAAWWGPVRSVLFGGIGTLLVVGMVAWRSPALRRLGVIKAEEAPHAASVSS
ncbi:MFS transporter [bacterium]|nr:MFS transporter [bacterium]